MQKFTTTLTTLAVLFGQVFGAFAGLSFAATDKALAYRGEASATISSSSITENSDGTYYINYCTDVEGYLTVGVYEAVGSTSSNKVAVIADNMRTVAQCSYVIWDGNYGDQSEVGTKGRKVADGEYFYGITLDGESPYSYGSDYKADWLTVGSSRDYSNNNDTYRTDRYDTKKSHLKVKKGYYSDNTRDPRIQDVFATKDSFDPNANESTYIVYTVTAKSDVIVAIYDDNGHKIETLEDKSNKPAGTYSVQWNGETADYSGTYTYKIYAENSQGQDLKDGTITVEEDSKSSGKPNIYKDNANEGIYYGSEGNMTIKFRLDRDADVTVEIRDGSTVLATIIKNESLLSGQNSVRWDGSGKYGSLESGIYQYKIIAANNKGKDVEVGTFIISGSTKYKYADSCGSFTDMTSDEVYCEAIKWASDAGIFTGYNDGSFKPQKSLTRAEALKVILESQNVQIENIKGENFGFYDVDKYSWYTSYLKTALDLGIVHGYNDGSFRPNMPISRVESLAILLNTAEVVSDLVVPSNTYGQPYYDTINDKNTKWYMSYVWFAKEYNLTGNDYYFYPDSNMTRGEMADMLYRFYKAGL